jgi:hypothetical protein
MKRKARTTGPVPILGALVLWAAGCGTAATAVHPDENSVEGHRAQAQYEHAAADQEASRYDPTATRLDPAFVSDPWGPGHSAQPFINPTEPRLAASERRRLHARAHERAAEQLEQFEATECRGVPARERAACPLLAPVVAIRDFPEGVRVELAPSASIVRVVTDMRCHYAFARARGFGEEAAECPLYIRGIEIDLSRDGQAIEVRGRTRELAAEIQKRVRQEAVYAPEARGR